MYTLIKQLYKKALLSSSVIYFIIALTVMPLIGMGKNKIEKTTKFIKKCAQLKKHYINKECLKNKLISSHSLFKKQQASLAQFKIDKSRDMDPNEAYWLTYQINLWQNQLKNTRMLIDQQENGLNKLDNIINRKKKKIRLLVHPDKNTDNPVFSTKLFKFFEDFKITNEDYNQQTVDFLLFELIRFFYGSTLIVHAQANNLPRYAGAIFGAVFAHRTLSTLNLTNTSEYTEQVIGQSLKNLDQLAPYMNQEQRQCYRLQKNKLRKRKTNTTKIGR